MSKPFAHQVLDAIQGRQTVMADDLMPLFPWKTRREITKALQNAERQGFVVNQAGGKQRLESGVFARVVWKVLPRKEEAKLPISRVRCVWELACDPTPIPFMVGTRHSPLGEWA